MLLQLGSLAFLKPVIDVGSQCLTVRADPWRLQHVGAQSTTALERFQIGERHAERKTSIEVRHVQHRAELIYCDLNLVSCG